MIIKMHLFNVCVLLSTLVSSLTVNKAQRLFDESVWDQVEASPFHVKLLPSQNPGHIRAIITNKGNKVAYYAINQLQASLNLYNVDDEPVQMIGSYHSHSAEPAQYRRFGVGQSTEKEFDIMSKYELNANEEYYAQIGGFMPFYLEGQNPTNAQTQEQIFEADIMPYKAPSTIPNTRLRIPHHAMAPSISFSNCSDADHSQKLFKSISHATAQAKKAISYVQSGTDRTAMQNFFKDDSAETRNIIIQRLTAVIKSLESTTSGPGKLTCASNTPQTQRDWQLCSRPGVGAFTEIQTGKVVFCPTSKRFPVEFIRCNDNNMGGVLVHELTHSRVVFKPGTVDAAYPASQCKALSKAKALLNANSYFWLGSSALQGGKSC